MALGGGPPTDIADAPDARGGTWGRGGSIVFAPTVTGTLFRVSASGGAATPLRLPSAGSGEEVSLRFPEFLPDSDRFFYTIEARTPEGFGIYVGSLNGDPPVRVLPDFSLTRFIRSSGSNSGGYILFCRQTTLMAQAFNPSSLKIAGEAFPIAVEVKQSSGNSGFAEFSASFNGVLIYAAGGNTNQERELVWLDRSGKHDRSILKQKGITDFALSPDKTRLLYSLAAEYVPGDLWLRDIASGASQRFTFRPFSAYSPVWSPDGATAVFTAFPEDQLYVKKVDSSAKEEALHVGGTDTNATSWSTDGKLIAFSRHGITTNDDLWLLPMGGENRPVLFKQTPYTERGPQISPDGRWIAYSSDASGRMEIYMEPITPGGAARQISGEGGINPQWRADGRELHFLSDRRLMAVDVTPGPGLTFKPAHELFHEPHLNQAPMIAGDVVSREITYQPNADGSQFLMLLSVGDVETAAPLTVVTNWQATLKK